MSAVPLAEGTGEPMGEPLTETREPVQASEEPTELPSAMGPDLEPAEQDLVPPRAERRRGFRFNIVTGTLVLAGVALLGGFLIVNLVLMPSFTGQGAEVHVPEVIGLSEREAERLLAAEDLKLSKISEQWSPDVPRGFITEQDPPAGGLVKRGRRISVIVSLGAQGTSVPVLEGVTARQATMLLENAGLKVGKTARAYADDVGKDLVIASDPPGETVVEQDAAVDLLVSLGPVPRSFVLPDLSGHDGNAAARGLRDQGIAVSVREGRGSQKSGDVNAQEPPAGRRVAPRDSVILYVQP
jgi:eukaryotic-like serine/threonine-protein kinase